MDPESRGPLVVIKYDPIDLESLIIWKFERFRELDLKAEETGLSELKVQKRSIVREQIWDWSRLRASILYQQSRIQWLREDDENSSFFHLWIARRKKRNQIYSIVIDGKRCEGVEEVKRELRSILLLF
ncbi:hypothetical protein RJT34_09935 [Clitoria ternatea]|uniref:Uncharacterized protein n=1 Tax=Clitoria ternatea TaxID=43366 RepID=A0AAN9PUX3_CLITE